MFESKKNTEDYHQEMNSECFEEWLQEILPKLKPDSVLVLDNAPYHSRKVEKIPTQAWKKESIKEWLRTKCITFDDGMLKVELMKIVKGNRDEYDRYVVDELAAVYGVTVLRLPPYHCELNPIELVWAQVKGYVARNNKTFKMKDVGNLLRKGLEEVTPEKWKACIRHTIKVEEEMRQLNHTIDRVVDTFVVNLNDDESSSSDEMFSSGSSCAE